MENQIVLGLADYEKDFLLFQANLPQLREIESDRFVAFKGGRVISSGLSVSEIRDDLSSQGVDPSVTVIEFVSKKEIKVIV